MSEYTFIIQWQDVKSTENRIVTTVTCYMLIKHVKHIKAIRFCFSTGDLQGSKQHKCSRSVASHKGFWNLITGRTNFTRVCLGTEGGALIRLKGWDNEKPQEIWRDGFLVSFHVTYEPTSFRLMSATCPVDL